MCLGNFILDFTADLNLSADLQLSFTKLLFELDFSGLEIGGLAGLFSVDFIAAFNGLDLGIDFSGMLKFDLLTVANAIFSDSNK